MDRALKTQLVEVLGKGEHDGVRVKTEHGTVCGYKTQLIPRLHWRREGPLPNWTAGFQGLGPLLSDGDELEKQEPLHSDELIHQWEKLNSSPLVREVPICEICTKPRLTILNVGGVCPFSPVNPPPPTPPGFCLLSRVLSQPENLAGCDCAERGNTFRAYRGVKGLEEPIGGQLTAQPPPPAPTAAPHHSLQQHRTKKSPLKKKRRRERRGEWVVNTLYKLASGNSEIGSGAVLLHEETCFFFFCKCPPTPNTPPPEFTMHFWNCFSWAKIHC